MLPVLELNTLKIIPVGHLPIISCPPSVPLAYMMRCQSGSRSSPEIALVSLTRMIHTPVSLTRMIRAYLFNNLFLESLTLQCDAYNTSFCSCTCVFVLDAVLDVACLSICICNCTQTWTGVSGFDRDGHFCWFGNDN